VRLGGIDDHRVSHPMRERRKARGKQRVHVTLVMVARELN